MGVDKSQYKYIYGIGKQSLNFTETDIRYAMDNTKSNSEAARFLKVSFTTYKKYAKQYTDSETGKTLWELHKNQSGKGIRKDIVKATSGFVAVEPSKVISGITLFKNTNLSPSPTSTGADSIKEVIAEPSVT